MLTKELVTAAAAIYASTRPIHTTTKISGAEQATRYFKGIYTKGGMEALQATVTGLLGQKSVDTREIDNLF